MRLFSFTKIAERNRADLLSGRINKDVLESLKSLNSNEVKKILYGFVPLDFVAILRRQNSKAFEQALKEIISQKLNSPQNKIWIEELGETKEDIISEIHLSLLSNDPHKRGIMSQISLDGSNADFFQYSGKDNPELNLLLKQTAAPSNGIVVPFCPTDKALGQSVPLWTIDTEGGSAKIDKQLDSEGKCLTYDIVGEMSQEEFDKLKTTKQGLNASQIQQINSNQRSLEFLDGTAFLRCTFQAQLPKFQNILSFRIMGIITSILRPERKKMGRNIPPEKYKRRDALELKEKSKSLSIEEAQELDALRDYFKEKQVDYVAPASSLDATVKSEDSNDKSLHDVVSSDSDIDKDSDALREAIFELKRGLGEKGFNILEKISLDIPLTSLLEKAMKLSTLSSKDPSKKQHEQNVNSEALKLSQKYLGKEENKRVVTCLVCEESYPKSVDNCSRASQMRVAILSAYRDSKDVEKFKATVAQLDSKSKAHYNQAHIESKVNSIYAGVEVSEDDLLDGIDFSGFESLESSPSASSSSQKLDDKTFKQTLEDKLDDKEKLIYFGLTISDNPIEVSEEDLIKVHGLAKLLKDTIASVVSHELEEELAVFLFSQGVS